MKINRIIHEFSEFTLQIENITLTDAKIIGLVGENGSGKTTFMSSLAGFFAVNGVYDVMDIAVDEVMFIPSDVGLFDMLSVYDFVELVVTHSARKSDPIAILDKLGLCEKRDTKLINLSEGMRKKLSLITLFTADYKYVLLDEPFNSIDVHYVYELKEQLKELRQMGATILISSHILDTLSDVCDEFIYIKAGKVIKQFANETKDSLEQTLFTPVQVEQTQDVKV
jgi:ABC-2 type transport system ATP-binding protein